MVCCAFSKISLGVTVRFSEGLDLLEGQEVGDVVWEPGGLGPGNNSLWDSACLASKTENVIPGSASVFPPESHSLNRLILTFLLADTKEESSVSYH